MTSQPKQWVARLVVLGVLAFIYFICYPQDMATVVSPVEQVLALSNVVVEKVLALSNVVSPWLYAVIGVAIFSWTVVRIWGAKPRGSGPANSEPPLV